MSLIALLQAFRRNAARRRSPTLARLALPLALHRAGLTPKIAPGLLGGRLLLSAMGPLTPWLACALAALAREADRATRRLSDLTAQHRAWYRLLAGEGRRGHSRAPAVLDLLAVIPVLSASLVARHLNCTPQGASLILKSLVRTGVLTRATSRARWQIFLAADLTVAENKGDAGIAPLMPSAVIREIDRDALDLALGRLYADLALAERKIGDSLARHERIQGTLPAVAATGTSR